MDFDIGRMEDLADFTEADRVSAISSISKIAVDHELANMLLSGVSDFIIESGEDLQRFYMMRHNWMHYLVCMNFSIPFRDDYSLEDFLDQGDIADPDCIRGHKYWDLIRNQTPDIIKMDGNGTILLIDVTVRSSEEYARRDKRAKYLTMQIALSDCGYPCEVIPIVFDSAARINQIDQVIEQLDDLKLYKTQSFKAYRQMINRILDTAKEIEKHSRQQHPMEFNMWNKFGHDQERVDYRINLTDRDISDLIDRSEYDPLAGRNPSDILDNPLMNSLEILPEDEKFLDDCAESVFQKYKISFKDDIQPLLGIKSGIPKNLDDYEDLMRSHTREKPKLNSNKKCFIMPFMVDYRPSNSERDLGQDLLSIIGSVEGNDHHSELFRSLARQINVLKSDNNRDHYFSFVGDSPSMRSYLNLDRSDTGCINIPMGKAQKAWHQSEGPGRKSLLRHGFQSEDPTVRVLAAQSAKAEKARKTAVLDWDTSIENLEQFISDISRERQVSHSMDIDMSSNFETFPVMDDMIYKTQKILSSCQCVQWLNLMQMISREIARNATRKRKGHKYCVSLCTDRRYGIILAPGFRITSSARPIWFKIFSSTEIPDDHGGGLFPDVINHGNCWSTEWRSLDIYQIESFIRVRDSFVMCLLSYCEATNNGTDDSEHLRWVLKNTDVPGTMASIMAAHNRSTSSVIQSARYLALRMLSINPDPWSLLKKDFNIPVRNKVLLFLLKRLVKFTRSMCDYKLSDLQGRMKSAFDPETGDVLDLDVDQPDDLPYVFCSGPGQSYSGLLCEIYFCMLFNKNQDEPSAAALNILEKIVIEEEKLVNPDMPLHFETGLLDDSTCIGIASGGFVSHFFSAHAVTLGAKLQARHEHNKKPMGSAVMEVIYDNKFIKSMDKYATFKASTISVERSADFRNVDPSVAFDDLDDIDGSEDQKELERIALEYDLSPAEFEVLIKRTRGEQLTPEERYQNNNMMYKISIACNPLRSLANRTKCVVNVVELLKENPDVVTNVDYLRKNIRNMEALIQIFKKNQIGGVREIEILTMDMRVLLEYVERVPTCISKYDEREMISAKQLKGEIIKANVMKMLSESAGKPVLNLNSCRDMSKWSQAFMPIIFFYTMLPYKSLCSDYVRTNMMAQVMMTNKRLELPAKLVELWLRNPEIPHGEPAMQRLKEKFLSQDRGSMDCTYLNRSGMGQGLEQTGSTVLHLGELSFRDELLKRVVRKVEKLCLDRGYDVDLWYKHFDAVSSDDKTTYKLLSNKFPDNLICLSLFKRVEAFSEALFCMQDSERKSVELINLAEFNSEFTMRYNQYSPLIKFAHKSALVPDTRSPLRAISQMFGTVQELRANGASSFLCRFAHYLNKDFIEGVFLTGEGMKNDPSLIFSCHRQFCPADLGVYPIFQPEMMEVAGLEYHNHLLLNKFNTPSQIKTLVSYLYQSGESQTNPDFASVERDFIGDTLPRRVHIEISVGMSANLIRARENCPVSKEDLESGLDPSSSERISILELLGPSKTNRVAMLRAASLLYTLGAKDSFKNTNGALYYARIGAMASGECFHIRNADSTETDKGVLKGRTFHSLVLWLKMQSQSYDDLRTAKELLSHFTMYDRCDAATAVETFRRRKPGFRLLKSRKMKTYSKSVILSNSLADILHYKWGTRPEQFIINSYERDWEVLKRRLPYLRESEEETLKAMNVKVTGMNLYKLLLELVKTSTEKNEFSKWLLVGSSSSDIMSTSFTIRYSNSFGGLVGDDIDYMAYASRIDEGTDISLFRYCVNCLLMDLNLSEPDMYYRCVSRFRDHVKAINGEPFDIIERISNLGRSGYLDIQDMKRLLMTQMLLERPETEIQDTLFKLNHSYIVWVMEQTKVPTIGWTGTFDVMIKAGRSTLRMTGHDDMRGLGFQFMTDKWDPFHFYSMLDTLVKIWYDKGLREVSMVDIRARCRQVVRADYGMMIVQSQDMRIPELRKLDWHQGLIPVSIATGWRSDDYFFDYRQIEITMGPVVKMATRTRKDRLVKFAGIFNGISPIHPAELAQIELTHGVYPGESVRILTKAGYQTNSRSLNRLSSEDLSFLIMNSKKMILADEGACSELGRVASLYDIQATYIPEKKTDKVAEEAAIYDRLLEELANNPEAPPSTLNNLTQDAAVNEVDFLNSLSLENATNMLNGSEFRHDLEDLRNSFQDEALMGAIQPSNKLRPKLMITQPPVSWSTMGQIYEQSIIIKLLPKMSRVPTKAIWVDVATSIIISKGQGLPSMDPIRMIWVKYCFNHIRIIDEPTQQAFLDGTLTVRSLMSRNPEPFNITYLSHALSNIASAEW